MSSHYDIVACKTSPIDFFLGLGTRCYEEKHDEEIQDLQERVRSQATIIVKYL